MLPVRAVNDEPIPGYRLLEPLGKGGFGEVWKCTAPGGLTKAIKFVPGNHDLDNSPSDADQELLALAHVKSLRHPFLLSIERVEVVRGDLLLVTELADRSLHDLLVDYRQAGHPGIPRAELLDYLHEAAEVLDVMNHEHGLQHLDVKPRNLFLVGRHIKVADFGLVASLSEIYCRGTVLSGLSPLYAAPETFSGRATLFSDQYSLAVTYHELLTGETPYKGKNSAQLAFLVSTTEPDLSKLSEGDREIVARAMNRDPQKRFRSCSEFIDALIALDASYPTERSQTTSYDLCLGDVPTTSVVPAVKRSAVLRRETKVVSASRSVPVVKTEQLGGIQLLECISRGPSGELWNAVGPRQDSRLVRFLVPPDANSPAAGALDRLMMIHHPSLAQVNLHRLAPNRVALVTEAGQTSLMNRFRACRAAGQPGVPREELLGFLNGAAQTLDELYHRFQLQHLTLTPRHLAFSGEHPLILEFGLAELLWLPQGLSIASLSPRYAALELFDSLISDSCDQFSLALMFPEMLVGLHPFRNLSPRQLASPKLRGQPDLALLHSSDRAVITQALDVDPQRRFRSCAEFVLALEESSQRVERAAVVAPVNAALTKSQSSMVLPSPQKPPPEWKPALEELTYAASRGQQILSKGTLHYRMTPGERIEQRSLARLAPGMARLKIVGFQEQWNAETISKTESVICMRIRTKSSLMQRCLGRSPGLRVEVMFGTPREPQSGMTPIRVIIEPVDCSRGQAEQVLEEYGPAILTSLQAFLSSQSDRASQERFPTSQRVHLETIPPSRSLTGQLRDLGMTGCTIRAKDGMPIGHVVVTLNRWESPISFTINSRVCDCRVVDGECELDVEFVT